jgi:hypothetical protein
MVEKGNPRSGLKNIMNKTTFIYIMKHFINFFFGKDKINTIFWW